MKQRLQDLEVGDEVAMSARYMDGYRKEKIIRVTATQLVTRTGDRFRKSDGRLVGSDGWGWKHVHLITPELEAKIAQQQALEAHHGMWQRIKSLGRPSHIQLKRLTEIYKELKGEQE